MSGAARRVSLAKLILRSTIDYGAELARLRAEGTLTRADASYGIEGAKRYVRALATGDAASDADVEARCATCRGCPTRTVDAMFPKRLGYCGERFRPTEVSCGCPLDVLTLVASAGCKQKKWEPVPRGE
jgi:hypothetical protein